MLLSEDILIVQDIMICQVQWHKYTNYTSCSNFTKALSKIQKHSLTASFEFFKLFHLERIPGWADRFAVKTSFSSRLEMYMQYQALCCVKYIGYMNSPTGHVLKLFLWFWENRSGVGSAKTRETIKLPETIGTAIETATRNEFWVKLLSPGRR